MLSAVRHWLQSVSWTRFQQHLQFIFSRREWSRQVVVATLASSLVFGASLYNFVEGQCN